MTGVIGIDPGISGAYAYISDHDLLPTIGDFPLANGRINAAELSRIIHFLDPTEAIVEHVHSMPKQGVASTFKFGMAFGTVIGVLAAMKVPTHFVSPHVWKSFYGLNGKDKDAARARAIDLWPNLQGLHLKKNHGRADALLMARYQQTKGL